MNIAVRNAVRNAALTPLRNAVLIALNFSLPYTIFHAVLSPNLDKAL